MTFEEILSRDGKLVYKTRGVSMRPMLKQDRDLITVAVPEGRLKPLDVALCRRGPSYVLHRVIRVEEPYYLIRGDNTYALEKVPFDAVIGVLTGFQRKGVSHSVTDKGYLRYARVWNAIYPLRACFAACRRFAAKVLHKLGITPLLKRIRKRGA